MRHFVPRSLLLAVMLACAAGSGIHAQVNRCVDAATGRVQYTDAACPGGQAAVEIEAAKTPEQLEEERQHTEHAIALQRERQFARQRELELRAQIAAQENLSKTLLERRPPTAADYAGSAACQRARRLVENATVDHGRYTSEDRARLEAAQDQADQACLSPDAYAVLQRQKALQTPPPVVLIPHPVHIYPRPPAYIFKNRQPWQRWPAPK